MVKEAPLLIAIDAAHASAFEITGLLGVPAGINTAVNDEGTKPEPQLLPAFQSALVAPNHVSEVPGQPDTGEPKPESVFLFTVNQSASEAGRNVLCANKTTANRLVIKLTNTKA